MATQRLTSDFPQQAGAIQPGFAPLDTSRWNDAVMGSIDTVREEVDDAFKHAKVYFQLNPDEAMRYASGYSARMSELKVRIKRIENDVPGWRPVRLEVEDAIEEQRFQYEVHSRLHTTREFDWKVEAGER